MEKINYKNDFLEKFRRARNAGTPLIAVTTFDPEATMVGIQKFMTNGTEPNILQWEIIEGWRGRNEKGINAMINVLSSVGAEPETTINPTESLKLALKLPEQSILFLLNPQHFFDRPDFLQALWNLRDEFKSKQSCVVMLCPEITVPEQLQQDILLLDEPLPTDVELVDIIKSVTDGAGVTLDDPTTLAAVDALRGLSAFPAEQSVAMSLRKTGLDIDLLWERKRKLISTTPGLKVYNGGEDFSAIGGCDQIKRFMRGVIKGYDSPNVIVFIDEGEKMFAGASGDVTDSSGVSQDYLATTLSYMEDNECDGAIFIGPPGSAKSMVAKATGKEAAVPTIMLDLGGMKGGLVGKSEAQLRNAYKIISAVGGGRAFFVMTCNKVTDLPPELRRRFTSGIFFFDLPTKAEREKIWPLYLGKYGHTTHELAEVDDEGWTGAEIRNCCRLAYRQNLTLKEAANFIVPVSKAAAPQIETLRRQASGSYLSANETGVYKYDTGSMERGTWYPKERKINLSE